MINPHKKDLAGRPLVDALFVASVKGGSSTVYEMLRRHPSVALPRANERVSKEPHYFSAGLFGPNYPGLAAEMCELADYRRLWQGIPDELIRCDPDPHTLHGPMAIARIAEINRSPKILMILRNPIARAYSHYLMDVGEGQETRGFLEAVTTQYAEMQRGSAEYCQLVRLGFYADRLDEFMHAFGSDRVRVWLFEDLMRNPSRVFGEMCSFIGVDPMLAGRVDNIRENEARIYRNEIAGKLLRMRWGVLRKPRQLYLKLPLRIRKLGRMLLLRRAAALPMRDEARQFLYRIYLDDMKKTEKIIGRKLEGWTSNSNEERSSSRSEIQKARQAEFYDEETDEEYEIERPNGTGRLYEWSIDTKFRKAIELLGISVKDATFLDICCGSGMAAEYYARAGAIVTGLDISEKSIARARERAKRHGFNASFITGDAERLPFADQSFDVVTVHDGLHHLPEPLKAVREMARVARKAIIVIEPARSLLTRAAVKANIAVDYEDAGNFVYRFREDEVFKIAGEMGLINHKYCQYLMYYRHNPFKWARYVEHTPVFYGIRGAYGLWNLLFPRLGNKICIVCKR